MIDPQKALQRADALKVVHGNVMAQTLIKDLALLPEDEQKLLHIRDKRGGFLFTYSNQRAPGLVLELVQSFDSQTNVATLYEAHSMLEERTRLMALRLELIEAIERVKSYATGGLVCDDPRRGRLFPGEMSTAELREMLKAEMQPKESAPVVPEKGIVVPMERSVDIDVPGGGDA